MTKQNANFDATAGKFLRRMTYMTVHVYCSDVSLSYVLYIVLNFIFLQNRLHF